MMNRRLYVTVHSDEPCQIVGVHPIRWGSGAEPQVFLVAVDNPQDIALALLEAMDAKDLQEVVTILQGKGADHA
jgi:hypothetical protein